MTEPDPIDYPATQFQDAGDPVTDALRGPDRPDHLCLGKAYCMVCMWRRQSPTTLPGRAGGERVACASTDLEPTP